MTPFVRAPPPDFWASKETQWQERSNEQQRSIDPLQWEHERRSLAAWFHERVRDGRSVRLCAYCDGSMAETSRETIDHFVPQSAHPALALMWTNLYPACDRCNSTYKGARWWCELVRPDESGVESLFDYDVLTGRLGAAPGLDRHARKRVRMTIRIFRLNEPDRCRARIRIARDLGNALVAGDEDRAADLLREGPYRFVLRRVAGG